MVASGILALHPRKGKTVNQLLPQSAIETIAVNMNEELATALNKWRHKQSPVPGPNEAIYELLVIALTHEGVTVGNVVEPEPEMVSHEDPVIARFVAALQAQR